MILLGSQVGTPAISPAGSNFDTMRALKSMPLRYCSNFVFENFFIKATTGCPGYFSPFSKGYNFIKN